MRGVVLALLAGFVLGLAGSRAPALSRGADLLLALLPAKQLDYSPCVDLYAAYPLSPVYQADELAPGLLPIPGLAHLTLAGAVPHGLRRAELLMQTLAPGVATPIHRHDCEEIFLVLRGEGTSRIRDQGGVVRSSTVRANSTFTVLPRAVHQLANLGQEDLQIVVALSNPPLRVFTYPSWETPDSSGAALPFVFWDQQCPDRLPPALQSLAGGAPAPAFAEL